MTISNKLQSFLYDNIDLINDYKFEEFFNELISLVDEGYFNIDDLINVIRVFHSSLGINLASYIKDIKLQALIELGYRYQYQQIKKPDSPSDTKVSSPTGVRKIWQKEREKETAEVKYDLRRTIEKPSTEYKDNSNPINPEYAKLNSTIENLIHKLNELSQGYQIGTEVDEFIDECQYKKLNKTDAYNEVIKDLEDRYDSSFLKKTWFSLVQRLVNCKYKLTKYGQE